MGCGGGTDHYRTRGTPLSALHGRSDHFRVRGRRFCRYGTVSPEGTAAALDTIHEFSEIAISDTAALNLTTRADVIGYDWKYYNFDAGVYTIVPGMNYVIRDRDGFYYKLRFVDFYNNTGEKGNPVFEYVRL